MKDKNKTKSQLIAELDELRMQMVEIERLPAHSTRNFNPADTDIYLSEEMFTKAFYCSPDINTISTLVEGRYIYVNNTFLKALGYEASEVIGHTVRELRLYDIPEERDQLLQLIMDTGRIRGHEVCLRSKDNVSLTALFSADIIEVAGERLLLCVGKDISDRKRMEEALRLSEERFSKAFNFSPITMSISTLDEGLFLHVNDSFCRVLGFKSEEVLGHTVLDIGFWLDPQQREYVKQSVLKYGSVSDLDVRFRNASGETRIGLYSAERVDINGEICLLSSFSDLTERKQMEIEITRLARLNLVGEMAASIAHEIRNPMTTVRGYLQILRDNQDYINEVESFDLMIEELDRANAIITEFLSLAKNKLVELKPINLNLILTSIFPLVKANAMMQDKGITMELEDVPDMLLDEKEIRQLILNMINNGLESTPAGTNINIRTFMESDRVVLAVKDQGDGIEHDVLEKLGTPFFTTKEHGTGLGLAVCYGIATRHNAKIDIETSTGGSTFFVRFKFRADEQV